MTLSDKSSPTPIRPEAPEGAPGDAYMLENAPPQISGTARWVAVAFGLLAVGVATALWLGARSLKYSEQGLDMLSRHTQAAKSDVSRVSAGLGDRLADVEKQNASLRDQIQTLSAQLDAAEDDASVARTQARKVRDQAGEEIRHLAAMNTALSQQLSTKASVDDVDTIRSAVSRVHDELKSSNNDAQMGRSELGTLIARNHDEIELLRQFGDRDYFEFTISGKNAEEKMGDVTITLRGTDSKKNECTLDLFVDDKTTERRNRTINEPIFFYRGRERTPSEIVVNQVGKNQVVGYLSVPRLKPQPTVAAAN